MSVQRWDGAKIAVTEELWDSEFVTAADHARIVAEAQARWVEIARQDRMAAHQRGAQEAERQHAKALADMEQAHAAALADANLRWDAEVTRALDEGEKIGRADAEQAHAAALVEAVSQERRAWLAAGYKDSLHRTLTADDGEAGR